MQQLLEMSGFGISQFFKNLLKGIHGFAYVFKFNVENLNISLLLKALKFLY